MPRSSAKRAPLGEMSLNHAMEKIAAKPQELNQTPMSPTFIEVTFDDGTGEDADEGVAPYSDDSGSDTDEEGWLDDVDLEKIEVLMRRTDEAITTTRDATRAVHALYRNDFVLAAEMVEAEAQARRARASSTDDEAARSISSSSVDENDRATGPELDSQRVKGRATSRRWVLASLAIFVTAAAIRLFVESTVDEGDHLRPHEAPLPMSVHPLANLMCG